MLSVLTWALVIAYFPSKPPLPPSPAAAVMLAASEKPFSLWAAFAVRWGFSCSVTVLHCPLFFCCCVWVAGSDECFGYRTAEKP